MAHKKGRRRHGRGMRGLAGLGNMTRPGALGRDVLPAVLGIGITLGGAIAIRSFIQPTSSPAMSALYRNAPLVGGAAGVVAGGVTYMATKHKAGAGPAAAVVGASVLSSAFAFGMEKLSAATPGAMSAIASVDSGAVAAQGTTGLAALVAETRPPGTKGMRGVIMEKPMAGGVGNPFGADINAPIRGAIVSNAFGRPQSAGAAG